MLDGLRVTFSRARGLLRNGHLEQDFDQEVQSHLALLTDENIKRGMTPQEAARQARIHFGTPERIKEDHRDRRGFPQLDSFFQDLRYAVRTLRRSPGFTLVAVLTLALGIGVNTTLFTAFDSVALKPLPVRDPEHVVRVMRWFESRAQGNGQYLFSYPEYLSYRDNGHVFSSLVAASMPMAASASMVDETGAQRLSERASVQMVSDNYFSDLGVGALLGRTLLPEESRTPGSHPVVVLSHPFWRFRFNGDPAILGKTIRLNNTSFTIVGVTPPQFIGTGNPPQVPDLWTSLMMQAEIVAGQDWLHDAGAHWFQLFGRLPPGVRIQQAQAGMMVLVRQFGEARDFPDKTIAITLERATFFGETSDPRFQAFVGLLMLVVAMVLLIACANLANMLLARAARRDREIGVRRALGASRGRLIRQLLTESVVLALLGGVAGLLFSVWASKLLWIGIQRALQSYLSTSITFSVEINPDARIFAYTILISLAAGILFGLAPALQLSRPDVSETLKEGSGHGHTLRRSWMRSFLLASQVGVSMALLICAGLAVRGLVRSQEAQPGFETRNVMKVGINYGTDAVQALALHRRLIARLGTVPLVKKVTQADHIPLQGTWTPPLRVDETHAAPASLPARTLANYVAPGFFETLGIPILRGRTFSDREAETGARVAIISEATAAKLWPGEDPIGKRAKLDMNFRGKWQDFEVVGVARDIRGANLSRVDPVCFYLPTGINQLNNILIRVEGDPKRARSAIRASVEAMDASLVASLSAQTLEETVVARERFLTGTYVRFALILASLAVVLAGIGIYGVMSYLVSQRVREIGIRMALGAPAVKVLRSVLADGLRPVLFGALFGLAGAGAVAALLKATLVFPGSIDFLYGISAFDPLTFLVLSAFLAGVAAIATVVPARRAVKVDPLVALRFE